MSAFIGHTNLQLSTATGHCSRLVHRLRAAWLRWNDSFLPVVVCSPGGASKSADYYDDYEYYSSTDILLPPSALLPVHSVWSM